MVIDKNELITENENTQKSDESLSILHDSQENVEGKDFNLISNEDSNNRNSININKNDNYTDLTTIDFSSNTEQKQEKETVETNCLALTVRKDYNLSIFKNSIVTTFRVSWKIAVSTFLLNLLKLFF